MKILSKNKKAYFDYEILEKFIAGIKLLGSEVKSVRNNQITLKDSYIKIENSEVFLYNCHISKYKVLGSFVKYEPERIRKLLLHKKEIRIKELISEKGLTCIPLNVHLSESGYIKLEIGICRGKKEYDKRHTQKEKQKN